MHSNPSGPIGGSRLEKELRDRDRDEGKTPTTATRGNNQGCFEKNTKGYKRTCGGSAANGQNRIKKISLQTEVPGVEDKGCYLCGGGEQTVHHILSMYRRFRAERKDTWRKEEKEHA